jgi:hypothetical protein
MAMLSIKQFGGIAPKIPARYLPDSAAQTAVNVGSLNTSLQPLQNVGSTVHTLTKVGTPQTIYRFGQDTLSDSLYWFHWTQDVDVARSQIPGDASEWTFYTGDGAPKATYNSIALSGSNYPSVSRPLGLPAPTLAVTASADTFTPDTYPAEVILTEFHLALLNTDNGILISTTSNEAGEYTTVSIADTDAQTVADAINAALSASVTASVEGDTVKIVTVAEGDDAKLFVKYDIDEDDTVTIFDTGYTDQDETPETRVYAYTWVNKESGFEFESAPSDPSNPIEIRTGQTASLSGFASVPGGDYLVTHKRIYRSVTGTYLLVAEISAAENTFTDDVDPEDLGEELLSLTWAEPPSTLKGLTNLPNGIMAGFTGRDVYMCDPYHPHAWPVEYINTVDYPVVGLGRMDTTLAVLTTGTPYFIQGSHPDSMAVVKSDIEQACVSKRSIVSMGGVVIYASPDGLIALAPSGSKNLTDAMFTHDQWQTFVPSSIHGYHQDGKYIGFYDTGSAQGGFMYDLQSGQFILHSLYAEAGYTDIQRDELFLAFDDRTVKKWLDGSFLSYTWKSKKFTLPQIMSFACAQLEAETYPVTMKVYADGSLIHTQTVANRNPFRLPAVAGRDWEVQLEGSSEVFSMAVAQSMSEIAGG